MLTTNKWLLSISSIVGFLTILSFYQYFYHKYFLVDYYYKYIQDLQVPTYDNVTGKSNMAEWEVSDYVPMLNMFFYDLNEFVKWWGLNASIFLFPITLVLLFIKKIDIKAFIVFTFCLLLNFVLIMESYD
jgi:hypothetical protein